MSELKRYEVFGVDDYGVEYRGLSRLDLEGEWVEYEQAAAAIESERDALRVKLGATKLMRSADARDSRDIIAERDALKAENAKLAELAQTRLDEIRSIPFVEARLKWYAARDRAAALEAENERLREETGVFSDMERDGRMRRRSGTPHMRWIDEFTSKLDAIRAKREGASKEYVAEAKEASDRANARLRGQLPAKREGGA